MMPSDAGLSMRTVLPRTFCHNANTGCDLFANGTPTANVVGTLPDEGGAARITQG
jgi:hypothetical protein